MRKALSLLALALSPLALSVTAAAGGSYAVSGVSVQTRDGSAWTEGAPVVLVVRATSPAGLTFPDRAISVVMQTDGERTKCLDVAMKRVSTEDGVATYAGVFYPFRAATYDGHFAIGDDVSDITFTVGAAASALAPIDKDADLPVLGPVRFDYGPDVRVIGGLGGIAALLFLLGAARVLARRRRTVLAA